MLSENALDAGFSHERIMEPSEESSFLDPSFLTATDDVTPDPGSTSNDSWTEASSHSGPSSDKLATTKATEKPARRRPIPRKGHTKSRRGCFNCKKRKIKCQEKRPSCDHCIKAGLICEYPRLPAFQHYGTPPELPQPSQGDASDELEIVKRSPSPIPFVTLSGNPGKFSLKDMKYFHHFLIAAYPHLPVGADSIWVTIIPTAAYQYDYLMSAMLALAASHLSALQGDKAQEDALANRVIAMQAWNRALSRPAHTRLEKDARMATALALTFQTCHLPGWEAYAEFCTLVRGCFLIGAEDGFEEPNSAFHPFRTEKHIAVMGERLTTAALSPCNPRILDGGVESLKALQPLCVKDTEKWYCDALLRILTFAYDYPSYSYFTIFYNWPGRFTEEEFKDFIDPNNKIAQCLLAHFIGVQHSIIPILIFERTGIQKPRTYAPTTLFSWLEDINSRLPQRFKEYLKWPLYVTTLMAELFAPRAFELPVIKAITSNGD